MTYHPSRYSDTRAWSATRCQPSGSCSSCAGIRVTFVVPGQRTLLKWPVWVHSTRLGGTTWAGRLWCTWADCFLPPNLTSLRCVRELLSPHPVCCGALRQNIYLKYINMHLYPPPPPPHTHPMPLPTLIPPLHPPPPSSINTLIPSSLVDTHTLSPLQPSSHNLHSLTPHTITLSPHAPLTPSPHTPLPPYALPHTPLYRHHPPLHSFELTPHTPYTLTPHPLIPLHSHPHPHPLTCRQ